MKMTTSAICTWDFTLKAEGLSHTDVLGKIEGIAKKWCFQKECGESGYVHYQGRVSLKLKTRKPETIFTGIHWSPTSTENRDNDFYTCKEDTRIDGPWKDTDEKIYIPRQIREITVLRPWQQQVIDMSKIWDKRHIDILYCPDGNSGKTTLKGYMRAYGLGRPLPFCNDFKDIMRMVMDMPTSKCYIIDMPRAINKDKLFQFYSAIEEIKNGYAYDDRYSFKEKNFDCPSVWVFTNVLPDRSYMSNDRWRIWRIQDGTLVPGL